MIRVDVTLNRNAVNRMLSTQGLVGQGFRKAGGTTVDRAQRSAPVKSGEYRRSIRFVVRDGPNGPIVEVIADTEYAQSIEFKQKPVLRSALSQLRPSDFT